MFHRVLSSLKTGSRLSVVILLVVIGAGTAAIYRPHPDFTGYATAVDTCDPNPLITYVDEADVNVCGVTIRRTWKSTDDCGNSSQSIQTIRIVDTTPPVIICPQDKKIKCDSLILPKHTGYAVAADLCDPEPSITYVDTMDYQVCGSIIRRTWIATDACGNTAQCVQRIKLADNEPPYLRCPPDITISCEDSTDPFFTGSPVVTDDCDPHPTVNYRDIVGLRGCSGYITRTWQATDSCGNTRYCMQRIKVIDITPPVFDEMPYINRDCEALPDDTPDCDCFTGWNSP